MTLLYHDPDYDYFVWTLDRLYTLVWDRLGFLGVGMMIPYWAWDGPQLWRASLVVISAAVLGALWQRFHRYPAWQRRRRQQCGMRGYEADEVYDAL